MTQLCLKHDKAIRQISVPKYTGSLGRDHMCRFMQLSLHGEVRNRAPLLVNNNLHVHVLSIREVLLYTPLPSRSPDESFKPYQSTSASSQPPSS